MTSGFEFRNRQPEGTPAGGQFAASARAEADVTLVDYETLDVGEWMEIDGVRIRMVPVADDDIEGSLELDVQVPADHPDAGEPDLEDPDWAEPVTQPEKKPRVPQNYATTGGGRRRFAAFAFGALTDLGGDMKAAWTDLERLTEESMPTLR